MLCPNIHCHFIFFCFKEKFGNMFEKGLELKSGLQIVDFCYRIDCLINNLVNLSFKYHSKYSVNQHVK